jgi:plastocyanin
MFRNHRKPLAVIGAIAALVMVLGCSSSNSPTNSTGGTKEFVSGTLNQNGSYQHVFTKAATYNYFCSFHGTATTGMHATITVTAGGTPSFHQSNITASTLETLAIDVGDTVRWTNLTTIAHNVQSAE